jgi:glycosyltransferase involved in cell wall biosynthesis
MDQSDPPLIIWNQRWEYDKNPSQFFDALYVLAEEGTPFKLALCGENFRQRPEEFEEALKRLSSHIVHVGYADVEEYRRLLWRATVTVSTTHHEFFGIAILEAIHCHTFPILPNRFSYPELLPQQFHWDCLYDDQEGMIRHLRRALRKPAETRKLAILLSESTNRFDWLAMAPKYDQAMEKLARTAQRIVGASLHRGSTNNLSGSKWQGKISR